MLYLLLIKFVTGEQPRTWPIDVFAGQYEYYGLITDPLEQTLTYYRESFNRENRVIERKLNGNSVKTLFESDKVHFIESFRHKCTTHQKSEFDNDINDITFAWKINEEHIGPAAVFASIGELLKGSKMVSRVVETKTNKIRNMPAWSWTCLVTYKIGEKKHEITAFVYFTEEGYEHR